MRRDRRLDRILDAGSTLLAERGFHGCTMRDVAARAEASPANLYRYVRGKEELLFLVQARVLERGVASAEAARAVRGAREQLKSFVTDHIRRVMGFPPEARLLRESPAPLPDHLRRRLDEQRGTYLDHVCGMIDAAVREKGTRRATLERRAQLLLGMADRVALDAAGQDPPPRADRLAKPVLDLFYGGVRRKR